MADYGRTTRKYSNEESFSHFEEVNFCYIYKKKSGLKVRVHRAFLNSKNPTETRGWTAQIEAANSDPTSPDKKNPPLDWANSIKMKLDMAELSTLSKYTDLAFIKALGAPIPMTDTRSGNAITGSNGRPAYKQTEGRQEVVKESFTHEYTDDKTKQTIKTRLLLEKSTVLYNGASILFTRDGTSTPVDPVRVTLSMDELILFARCCKMAFEFLCQAMVDEAEEKYLSWKKAKENGIGVSSNNYSKSSYSNDGDDGGTKYYGYNGGGSSYTSYRSYNNNTAQNSGPRPVSYDSVASGGTVVDNSPIINDGDDIPF